MADYQLVYNGTTFGAGTAIQLLSASGLEDLPDIRSGDISRAFAHGEAPGLDLAAGRNVDLQLLVTDSGAGDYWTNIETMKALSVPQTAELQLTYTLPGRAARTLMCRPRRRALTVDTDYQFRYGAMSLQFHATDPRIYSSSFTSGALTLPTALTGLTFPATSPFVFTASGTGATLIATNSGNTPAPWVAVLAGPLVNPTITLASTGSAISLGGTLAAGEVLTIDSLARSILLNGTASRYSWLATSSAWFSLPVGTSTVQFGGASGAGSLTFSYRSTWI